ncbi:MAG TPA: phosphoribosylanthranilate isomerase [Methylophilaceae bacterium]|nr:phosphoribosylanthranilate isomerase [Methylophilaceae bacterium]
MRTRVKFCGITSVADALAAVQSGCDAIGLVFYKPSPRYVNLELAAAISASIPPFVSVVGLFVDAPEREIREVLARVRLDLLQFHGEEAPAACGMYDMPYIKAVRVRQGTNLLQYAADYGDAKALLLDTYKEGTAGGTGEVFDWRLIPSELPKPVVLAGGLNAQNVANAIRQVQPYAVDVSGGVEKSKGIKDADRMAAFMRGVQDAAL